MQLEAAAETVFMEVELEEGWWEVFDGDGPTEKVVRYIETDKRVWQLVEEETATECIVVDLDLSELWRQAAQVAAACETVVREVHTDHRLWELGHVHGSRQLVAPEDELFERIREICGLKCTRGGVTSNFTLLDPWWQIVERDRSAGVKVVENDDVAIFAADDIVPPASVREVPSLVLQVRLGGFVTVFNEKLHALLITEHHAVKAACDFVSCVKNLYEKVHGYSRKMEKKKLGVIPISQRGSHTLRATATIFIKISSTSQSCREWKICVTFK